MIEFSMQVVGNTHSIALHCVGIGVVIGGVHYHAANFKTTIISQEF